jgi:GT2 family glycosyltransferase
MAELVSISIVTYYTWEDTRQCVEAALSSRNADINVEILIWNNAADAPPEDLVAVTNREPLEIRGCNCNLGFGGGHNANFEYAKGDYFLVLNPDAQLAPDAIRILVQTLRDPTVIAAAPQLRNVDGTIQHSCRRLPRLRYEFMRLVGLDRLDFGPFAAPLMRKFSHETSEDVEQPAGAALLLRRCGYARLGGFDTDFPMYFDDVDLCRRIIDSGGRIRFEPRAIVVHGRERTARHFRAATTFWLQWSRVLYYRKHEREAWRVALAIAVSVLSSLIRAIALGLLGCVRGEASMRQKSLGHLHAVYGCFDPDSTRWRDRFLQA